MTEHALEFEASRLAAWVSAALFAVGGCGPPPLAPPPVVRARPSPPPTASSAVPAPPPICPEAQRAVDFLRAVGAGKAQPGSESCEVRASLAALDACPELRAEWGDRRAALVVAERSDDDADFQQHGSWAVRVPGHGDMSVWEVGHGGAQLRYRIDGYNPRFVGPDHLFVDGADLLVHLPSGVVHPWPRPRRIVAASAGYLFVSEDDRILRLKSVDLAPAGEVAWGAAASGGCGLGQPLRSGAVLVCGQTLVSFAAGKVIRDHVQVGEVRPDEARIVGCDLASKEMVEIDTASGAITAHFARRGQAPPCEFDRPGYAPDPRYVFWFEPGKERPDEGRELAIAVGDTRTGQVRRAMHPKRGTSTGFTFGAFTDERDARLCLSLGSFKVGWTICDWQLSKSGAPRFAPRPRRQPKPTLAALGLQGEEEAARATSPSGARTAIATYRAPQQDLKLTVVDATGAVERTVMLMKGDFPLDTTGIVEEEGMSRTPGTLVALPAIVFLDEDRVAYHAPYFPCQVVDLESGVVNFQAPACAPPGLMVVRVGEARWVRLSATTDQWLAAPRIAAPCGAAQAAQLDLTPSVQER